MATIQVNGKYRFDFRNFDVSVLSGVSPFQIHFSYSNQMTIAFDNPNEIEPRFVGLIWQDGVLEFFDQYGDHYSLNDSNTLILLFEVDSLVGYIDGLDAYVDDLEDVPLGELFNVQTQLVGLDDEDLSDYFENSDQLFVSTTPTFELKINNGYSHVQNDDTIFHIYCGGLDVTSYFSSSIVQRGGNWYVEFNPNAEWNGWFDVNIQIVAEQRKSDYDITFNVVGATYSPTTETYQIHDDTDAITFTKSGGYTWTDAQVQILYGGVDVTSTYWDATNHQVLQIEDIIDDVVVNVRLSPTIRVTIMHNSIATILNGVYKPTSMLFERGVSTTTLTIETGEGTKTISYTNTSIPTGKQLVGLKKSGVVFVYLDVQTLVNINENITLTEYIETIPSVDEGLDLYIYQSSAEINEVDKSNKLTQILHITGILREGTTLVNPSIIVESSSIIRGNYAYIPQFERYYFIEDIVADHYNKWRVVLRCDVLMSYRNKIRQQTGFIARNEFEYDDYLIDSERLTTNDYQTTKYEVDDELIFDMPTNTELSMNVVLTIASSLFTDYVNINQRNSDKSTINEYPHGRPLCVTNTCRKAIIGTGQALWFTNQIIKGNFDSSGLYSDLSEYVLAIRSYPFNIDASWQNGWNYGHIAVGRTQLKESGIYLDGYYVDSTKQKYFDFTISKYFNNFMDYAPYTTIKMYIAYIGMVDLDVNMVMGEELRMWYMLDIDNGTIHATLVRKRDELIVGTWSSSIAVDLPIGRSNETDRQRNKYNQNISLAIGMGASLIGVGMGLATMNPLGVVGGAIGVAKTLSQNAVNNVNNNQQHFSSTKLSGEISKIYLPQRAYIEIKRPNPIPIVESEYNHLKGKPLGEYRTLSTMRGFTILDNIHLTGFNIATEDEIKEIETHLLSGVIL